jgi:glycoside/pentoside/hexuronide:cation symporter, GPH family
MLQQSTPAEDRVPFKAKVAIGAANMVGNLTSNLTLQMITPVFVVALALSPTLVSIAMIVFRLYDAITDLLMGWISDNTRTRWGRRRPYLFVGTLLCAAVLPVMWMVGRDWPSEWQLAWLLGAGLLLFTCTTIFSVPYESFSLELTPDYQERTSVASYKMILSTLASLVVGWSWSITQLPMFNDPVTGQTDILAGARALFVVAAIGVLLFGMGPVFLARERFYERARHQQKVSLWSNCRSVLGNRAFLLLASIGLFAVTGSILTEGIGFYTNLYHVSAGDQALAAKLTGARAMFWVATTIVAVFLFQTIGNRWSKHAALMVALMFSLASMACRWWVLTPDMPYLSLISSGLLCFGITGMWQMLPAMNADVIDSDELKTSVRREGGFASIFSWFMKLSFTAGIGLPGILVSWIGFQEGQGAVQSAEFIAALRFWDITLPGALTGIAMLLILAYPLTPVRMAQIRKELELRRGRL